jgi:phosphocarrier protein
MRTAICKAGLHARPAAVFVKAVLESGERIRLSRPHGVAVDARSIVSVLALDIRPGETVVLTGPDPLVDGLAALLEADP